MPPFEKQPLSLRAVSEQARQTTLQAGSHAPTVIADGDKSSSFVVIEQLAPTYELRVHQLMQIGLTLAREADIGVLQQAFFISEAWMASRSANDPEPYTIPASEDPKRREILLISRTQVKPTDNELVIYEMKRNKREQLVAIDLVEELSDPQMIQVYAPILAAFVIGFQNASRSNERRNSTP